MRILLAALLILSATVVLAPAASACHPVLPVEAGPVYVYVDPHGCGPDPVDPAVCVRVDDAGDCLA